MILVGLLAGKGLFEMAEKVVAKIAAAPQVAAVWVLTPHNRFRSADFFRRYPKVRHINS